MTVVVRGVDACVLDARKYEPPAKRARTIIVIIIVRINFLIDFAAKTPVHARTQSVRARTNETITINEHIVIHVSETDRMDVSVHSRPSSIEKKPIGIGDARRGSRVRDGITMYEKFLPY